MKPPSPLLLPLAKSSALTLTRVTTTTTSSTGFIQWISPHAYTHTTILAVTRYEPQTVSLPPPYPATATQTAVTSMTMDETTRWLAPPSGMKTTRSMTAWTAVETWLVSPRLPESERELDADAVVDCLETGPQTGAGSCVSKVDERCETMGLKLGCQERQCELRGDGQWWWCLRMEGWEWVADPGRRMGRVCWGGEGRVRQLGEACEFGDGGVACPGCGGDGWVGVDVG